MDALLLAVQGGLIIVSFVVGAKVGQTIVNGKSVNLTDLNPVNAIKEHNEKKQVDKEQRQEQRRMDTILRNIDVYDGTSIGQREVPKG